MQSPCICKQPNNSDIFKGHELDLVGAYELSYNGGYPRWGIKPKWGGQFKKAEDIMPICINMSSNHNLQ